MNVVSKQGCVLMSVVMIIMAVCSSLFQCFIPHVFQSELLPEGSNKPHKWVVMGILDHDVSSLICTQLMLMVNCMICETLSSQPSQYTKLKKTTNGKMSEMTSLI